MGSIANLFSGSNKSSDKDKGGSDQEVERKFVEYLVEIGVPDDTTQEMMKMPLSKKRVMLENQSTRKPQNRFQQELENLSTTDFQQRFEEFLKTEFTNRAQIETMRELSHDRQVLILAQHLKEKIVNLE